MSRTHRESIVLDPVRRPLAPHNPRIDRYERIRSFTEHLCEPLEIEDCVVQSMPDASPVRWHLAHTTWFFETFVLLPHRAGYKPFHPRFGELFNSYYNSLGAPFPRARRGLLSRPTVAEIGDYRRHVDRHMSELLAAAEPDPALTALVGLGLQHEQQHQELILTDVKHALSCNPLLPAYRVTSHPGSPGTRPARWRAFDAGLRRIGHAGDGFCFDNERPRHRVFLEPFELADRLVTNAEYRAFIDDGGYWRSELWLSAGWATVQSDSWTAPLYWHERDGAWHEFTLAGLQPLEPDAPVCHVSYFEADAFARWAGARLPTEFEWEAAAHGMPIEGNFLESAVLHPRPVGAAQADEDAGLQQMFGDVWQWTASAYLPYPGYRPPEGAVGEYNGKFMCNQHVLRGGSCATPRDHIRATYRNFFPPDARWQFTGIRLARSS